MNKNIMDKIGIYMAYPTTSKLKSIYKTKNYKTMVNNQHTNVGITKDSFGARSESYYSNFDGEAIFKPLVIIGIPQLEEVEKIVLSKIEAKFSKVGRTEKWFDTSNRKRIEKIVINTVINSGIKHECIN